MHKTSHFKLREKERSIHFSDEQIKKLNKVRNPFPLDGGKLMATVDGICVVYSNSRRRKNLITIY